MAQVTLTIDGHEVTVEEGTTIIEAAKEVERDIPHYCYHPGLKPDGNCRMCLVKAEKFPKPLIACKATVSEGMVVDTKSEEVEQMRQSIMEFLLINHPLDCPTCDQAGECRLQDYYMDYDRIPSRFNETKVKKDKMVDLGAGVMLDEERCIICQRCVRFCDEIAGVPELHVQARGDHSMVSTFPGQKMENPYAGNVVDICPVGALTSKDFRYKKRVWLLESADSVCPGCSRGCNITVDHSERKVYRLKPRHNSEVNDYWMCDEGRYDYKFINDKRRLKPGYKVKGELAQSSYEEALRHLGTQIPKYNPEEVAFVASARESHEEIDAFLSLAQDVFEATEVLYSKHNPSGKFSDDILITNDKNPNLNYIKSLKLRSLEDLSQRVKAVVVQRDLDQRDWEFLQKKGVQVLLVFATNETYFDNETEVVLPIPTYAEQTGHFTNVNGLKQKFEKVFEPRGESKTVQTYLEDFRKIMTKRRKSA